MSDAERHYAVVSDAIRPGGFGFRDEVTPEEARHEPIVAKCIAHLREMSRSASEHFA